MTIKNLKPFDYIYDEEKKLCLEDARDNISLYTTLNNSFSPELKTHYLKADGETVLESQASNAFIILGRDRNAGISSGKGGGGWTGASSVDIIAGHMGAWPISDIDGQPVLSSKDFKNDACRIYMSQMCDVDSYFEIPKTQAVLGTEIIDLEHSDGFSAIALKSDAVRLIARENIKLVTFHRTVSSQNINTINGGIDIMAGCNMMGASPGLNLQPMVKGNNLIELLQAIIRKVDEVQNTVTNFMNIQKNINDILSKHTHQSNKAGLATSDIIGKGSSIENFKLLTNVLPNILQNYVNSVKIEMDYFNERSEKYIVSRWNRVN